MLDIENGEKYGDIVLCLKDFALANNLKVGRELLEIGESGRIGSKTVIEDSGSVYIFFEIIEINVCRVDMKTNSFSVFKFYGF